MKVNFSQEGESTNKDRLQPSDVEPANAQLTAHPFLSGMSPHHLQVLATAASTKRFQKGEIIFRAGEAANGFYLIQTGSVAIEGSVFEHGAITTIAYMLENRSAGRGFSRLIHGITMRAPSSPRLRCFSTAKHFTSCAKTISRWGMSYSNA